MVRRVVLPVVVLAPFAVVFWLHGEITGVGAAIALMTPFLVANGIASRLEVSQETVRVAWLGVTTEVDRSAVVGVFRFGKQGPGLALAPGSVVRRMTFGSRSAPKQQRQLGVGFLTIKELEAALAVPVLTRAEARHYSAQRPLWVRGQPARDQLRDQAVEAGILEHRSDDSGAAVNRRALVGGVIGLVLLLGLYGLAKASGSIP
jgi:hypothetical protein